MRDGESGESLEVAVVIPTRDRGAVVQRAARSALGGERMPFEVIVVDQSDDPVTRDCLAELDSDRIRYRPSDTVGISASLNAGISATDADIIAITGDDCEAHPEWLRRIAALFEENPAIGVLFGRIVAGGAPDEEGFSPSYEPDGTVSVDRPGDRYRIGGTSACMALRRAAWEEVGGFDEQLGVGCEFGAAEDVDFTRRALLAGWHAAETPEVQVTHHGRISWARRSALISRNWFGTGAALAKPLRTHGVSGLVQLAPLASRWIRGRSRVARGLGPGPYRMAMGVAFARGFVAGLRRPLDLQGCFEPRPGRETPEETISRSTAEV